MKTEIKNFLKSNLLGLVSLILILSGGTYASTIPLKNTNDTLTAAEFNKLPRPVGGLNCSECPFGTTYAWTGFEWCTNVYSVRIENWTPISGTMQIQNYWDLAYCSYSGVDRRWAGFYIPGGIN